MRILLVSFIEDNRWTGMGKWSHRIAGELTRLGHTTEMWFADNFPRVRRMGRLSVLIFPLVLAARLLRHRRQFDVVIIHEPSGFWYAALRRLFPSLPPLVLMCHNVESKCYRELLLAAKKEIADMPRGTRLKAPLFRLWQSDGSIKQADHVVCLSTVDYEYIVNHLGCHRERITCLVNGVLSGDGVGRSETVPLKRVLFVGGWLDIKGKRLLPSIWSKVHARFPDATLKLIGTGVSEEVVLADFFPADRLSVTVIPRLDDEAEMLDQFSRHDVFLMPSLSEGSPLSLLEAMAAMMPVVATRAGGIPDIITHEEDGLLFNSGEISDCVAQVCRLLSDSEMAGRLARNALQRAATLSWTNSAKMLERAAESVLLQSSQGHEKSQLPLSTGIHKS